MPSGDKVELLEQAIQEKYLLPINHSINRKNKKRKREVIYVRWEELRAYLFHIQAEGEMTKEIRHGLPLGGLMQENDGLQRAVEQEVVAKLDEENK